jgi:CMP-N,N'-diacetyllegionaminic acid synthase
MPTAVALLPARAGSERVPGKNVHPLAGHPLIAYTIAAALESDVFDLVRVSTDSPEIAEIAEAYGADVPRLRPADMATASSPDVDWVLEAMRDLDHDAFSILRPTSPFRQAHTIRRAWELLLALEDRADSVRAVEPVRQHPGKMWIVESELMRPLLPQEPGVVPSYSRQAKVLPQVYVQNSSLEIAWRRVLEGGMPEIAGPRVAPFMTEGWEGFSIDYPEDLDAAERAVAAGVAQLPVVRLAVESGG